MGRMFTRDGERGGWIGGVRATALLLAIASTAYVSTASAQPAPGLASAPSPAVEPPPPRPVAPTQLERRDDRAEREYEIYWAARDWRDGDPAPPGYRLAERPWTGMIVGGAIPLGITYMLSITGATAADFKDGTGWLLVPVIGPFINMAALPHDRCDSYSCDTYSGTRAVLVLDGLTQATSLALVIIGMTSTRHRLVRDYESFGLRPAKLGSGYGLAITRGF